MVQRFAVFDWQRSHQGELVSLIDIHYTFRSSFISIFTLISHFQVITIAAMVVPQKLKTRAFKNESPPILYAHKTSIINPQMIINAILMNTLFLNIVLPPV